MLVQHHDGEEFEESHEINVTPFIDVMLVLLIIFMVAAPLSTVDIAVDLPTSTAQPLDDEDEQLTLALNADLTLSLNGDAVLRAALESALDAETQSDKESRVFLQADRSVDYGDLMDLMNALREAGYLRIALVGLEDAGG